MVSRGNDSESHSTDALELVARDGVLAEGTIVLGKYRIDGRLGSGGMAEVYEATHVSLGSRVALKLPLGRAAGAKVAARLLREAQVGASLDPERVVRVFDVGTLEDGTPVIVLERLDGESMADMLGREGSVPVESALRWVRDACEGLREAHAKEIVHRDVKPSNLFLERRRDGGSRLRILDFGIARIRAAQHDDDDDAVSLTDSRGAIGSPPYMSPEQLKNSATADARADVWALGVTLFELIAGRRPFRGAGTSLVAAIVSDLPPTFASLELDVPPDVEAIVAACLSKDPSGRPRDAGALADRIDAARLETSAAHVGLHDPARSNRPRERSLTSIGIVGAVVLAALGTAVFVGRNGASTATEPTRADITSSPPSAPDAAPHRSPAEAPASASAMAVVDPPPPPAASVVASSAATSRNTTAATRSGGATPANATSAAKPEVSAARPTSLLDSREF